MQLADDVGKLVDGAGELAGIQHKAAHAAQGNASCHVQQRAQDAHRGHGEVVDQVHGGAGDAGGVVGVPVGVDGALVTLSKAAVELVLLVIGGNGLHAGNSFLGEAVEHTQLPGAFPEQGTHHLGAVAGEKDGQGDGEGEDDQQRRGDGTHHGKAAHHGDQAGEDLRQVGGEGCAHGVHIVGEDGDHVAGLVGIEEADGQAGEVVEQVAAHPLDHIAAHADHHGGKYPAEQGGRQRYHDHPGHIADDHGENHVPGGDGIDGGTGQLGGEQPQQIAHNAQQRGGDDDPSLVLQVLPQAAQHLARLGLGAGGGGGVTATVVHHRASPPNCNWHSWRYMGQLCSRSSCLPWAMMRP